MELPCDAGIAKKTALKRTVSKENLGKEKRNQWGKTREWYVNLGKKLARSRT